MKILIADDHELFLKGLEFMLQSRFPDASILTASNYMESFEILKNVRDFDLIITDLAMPGANSLQGIEKIHQLAENSPIIILSAVFDKNIIKQTIDIGVGGYVLKASSNQEISYAINIVMAGGVYIPQELIDAENELMKPLLEAETIEEKPNLTARQKEVLQKIAEGKSNKQIAFELDLTEGTVKYYITAILKKLNVLNRTAAGLKAVQFNLINKNK